MSEDVHTSEPTKQSIVSQLNTTQIVPSRSNNVMLTGTHTGLTINVCNSLISSNVLDHLESKSAALLFLQGTCTYCTSISSRAAIYHMLQAQAPKKGYLARPDWRTFTTAWLSHFINTFLLFHYFAKVLMATNILAISR